MTRSTVAKTPVLAGQLCQAGGQSRCKEPAEFVVVVPRKNRLTKVEFACHPHLKAAQVWYSGKMSTLSINVYPLAS